MAATARVYGRNAARVPLDGRPDQLEPGLSTAPFRPLDQRRLLPTLSRTLHPLHTAPSVHGTRRSSRPSRCRPGLEFNFEPSTVSAGKYQQTIATGGNRVFIGGSSALFSYGTGTNSRTSRRRHHEHGRRHAGSTISLKNVIYGSCLLKRAYQDRDVSDR